MKEQYLCRLDMNEAWDIFIKCRKYDGPINIIEEPRPSDRFILLENKMKIPSWIPFIKKRNNLKDLYEFSLIPRYFAVLKHLGIEKSDFLYGLTYFFVRSDGLCLRDNSEHETRDGHRDYLFLMPDDFESENMYTYKELQEAYEKGHESMMRQQMIDFHDTSILEEFGTLTPETKAFYDKMKKKFEKEL